MAWLHRTMTSSKRAVTCIHTKVWGYRIMTSSKRAVISNTYKKYVATEQ